MIDISSRPKDDVGESESKVGNVFVDQVLVEEKLKAAKADGDLDDRSCKKAKLDNLTKASYDNKVKSTQKLRHDSLGNSKAVAQITPASEDKLRPDLTKDPHETNNALSEKPKPDEKLANGKFPEASLRQPSEEGSETNYYKIQEPIQRPETVSCITRSLLFSFIYQGLLLNNFNVALPFI